MQRGLRPVSRPASALRLAWLTVVLLAALLLVVAPGLGGREVRAQAVTPAAPTAPAQQPPTATPVPPTATPVPPTATPVPPTATPVPPTATAAPPTATPVPPTATAAPPTATPEPPPLVGIAPSSAGSSTITLFKVMCDRDQDPDSTSLACQGPSDAGLDGYSIDYVIYPGLGTTSGAPFESFSAVLSGYQATLTRPLEQGDYTICEVPQAHKNGAADAVLKPYSRVTGDQNKVGHNCIACAMVSAGENEVVTFLNTQAGTVTPTPTATPVPPTATPVPPTATPVPPTATPVPPTATTPPGPVGLALTETLACAEQPAGQVEGRVTITVDGPVTLTGYEDWIEYVAPDRPGVWQRASSIADPNAPSSPPWHLEAGMVTIDYQGPYTGVLAGATRIRSVLVLFTDLPPGERQWDGVAHVPE